MIAENKSAGCFYCNLKIHKPHDHIPPPRPLISGSESITENIGKYVEHHIHNEATKHKSYLQDTPHFLRIIDRINRGPKLNPKTMAVTLDATALYTNIIHEEGLNSLEAALEKRDNPKLPTTFLVKLMEIILTHDAMGSPPVPSYANIFR